VYREFQEIEYKYLNKDMGERDTCITCDNNRLQELKAPPNGFVLSVEGKRVPNNSKTKKRVKIISVKY